MFEIHFTYTTNLSLYGVRRNEIGNVALSDGSAFEAWGASGHGGDDYDITITENGVGSSHYVGHFDESGLITNAGRYFVDIYKKIGDDPVTGDPLVGVGIKPIIWDGNKENSEIEIAIIEGTTTQVEALRLMLSILTGKTSGGGSETLVFRDISDSKDRLICTVDVNGNRLSIGTRDGS